MNPELGFSIGSDVCPGLSKLIEEAGEVIQIAGKLIATGGKPEHWDGTHLGARIQEELGDLAAAATFFIMVNGLDGNAISDRCARKLALFNKWHEEQEKTS